MATILLDSLVGSCAKKLQHIISEDAIMILGVKEELKELRRTVNQIQCFLNDAEKRRTDELAVNNWLSELKDAMYEADDIIDLARSEGSKLLQEYSSSTTSSSPSDSYACYSFSFLHCLPNIWRRHEIAVRIRNFNTELERISKLGERFLKFQNMQPLIEVSAVGQAKAGQLVEPNLVGNETLHSCTSLVELILTNKEKKLYKLAIVGTAGVGKTTLAQKIYNDQKVKRFFSEQPWICVSQKYSPVDILKEILRNLGVRYEHDENVGELGGKLATTIKTKSFFLVLDDVWHHDVWINLLRIPFSTAENGVVLITTRNDTVARVIGVDYMHRVELMSPIVGWELLWKSMNIKEESEVLNLRDIGMEIVRLCGGLPLAIKVIASVLASKEKNENQWRMILNKSVWSMGKLPVELRGALYLSYDELPHYLKQCFLYGALCPEGRSMSRDDLIRYWIAEGFVEEQEDQLLEDTAEEYYNELICRNLLQRDDRYLDNGWCKIHDLLRQLARHLVGEETFCGDPQSLEGKSLRRLRRVSIVTDKDSVMFPNMDKEQTGLRTWINLCGKTFRVDGAILEMLPRIRVLDLSDVSIQSSPSSIGNLIHLRLLDLDRSDISYLPESIGSLINLQILSLRRCDALHVLPLAITKLYNLRRLGLRGTPINQVPKGIMGLKFLNDLEGFPIGGSSDNSTRVQDGWSLEELGPLSQLRKLDIIKLEKAAPCTTDLLLADKKYLKILRLCCSEQTDETCSEEDVINIETTLEQLIPSHNLEDLAIGDYYGRRFPSWLGIATHFPSLMYLSLIDCKSCVHLPPIGQLPNLKYVKISGAATIKTIGPEFACYEFGNPGPNEIVAFSKLESLIINDMRNLERWAFFAEEEDVEAMEAGKEEGEDGAAAKKERDSRPPKIRVMPCLNMLELEDCPKLRALPLQLGQEATSLKNLHLSDLNSLQVVENLPFLSESLFIARCEGLEKVSNLPKVRGLYALGCPNLRCVEKLDNLQDVWLGKDMEEVFSLWLPGLQEQRQHLHGEDLDVYN